MADYPEKPKRGKQKNKAKRAGTSQRWVMVTAVAGTALVIFIAITMFVLSGPSDGGETELNAALKDGRYLDAIDLYSTQIERGRNLTENHIGRATAHFAIGDYDAALADYERALERDPDNPEIEYGRGQSLAAANIADTAVEAFSRAIDLAAPRPPAEYYLALGRAYEQLEDIDAAIEQYYLYIDAAGDDVNPDMAAYIIDLELR
ncbi:MAG: tetratricopeptide repeat protein [Chloroflexota bacterium]